MKTQTLRPPQVRAIAHTHSAPTYAHSAMIWLVLALAAGLCTASVLPLLF